MEVRKLEHCSPISTVITPQSKSLSAPTIPLAELCEHPLIALPVGTGIRHQLDMACAAAGVVPRIAFEASAPPALADLAGHGLGIAVIPRSMAASRPDLHALRIVPELRGRLALAWRSTGPMNPATTILVQKACRQVRAQSATSVRENLR